MGFFSLSKSLNSLLYRKEVRRLSKEDREMANRWTLEMIRESHPDWSEERVRVYFNRLLYLRVTVVDEWSLRHKG